MRISIGADHAGFELKQHLIAWLDGIGHEVLDRGTSSDEPVDYPPYCAAVGRDVVDGEAERGIVLGGSGQGEQIAANKVRGVRAALCNDLYTARMAREHNDANVLSIGGRIVATGLAEQIVELFLSTPFRGGRHERRVHQIEMLESFDLHEALYTTRAMRRLKDDPIPEDVVIRILDAAVRGPSSGNDQNFRFLTVTDPATKAAVAELYQASMAELDEVRHFEASEHGESGPAEAPESNAERVARSSGWLAEHLADAPLLLFIFGRSGGQSSTFPVLWNACLAARAEGIGTTMTTALGSHRSEIETLLGIPSDEDWEMHAMVPMGYPLGAWDVAARRPAHESTFAERWGNTVEWRNDLPLWPRV